MKTAIIYNRYKITDQGRIYDTLEQMKEVNQFIATTDDLKQVWLRVAGKRSGKRFVHRMVAEQFCPNDSPKTKKIATHINRSRYDNRAENLEWITRSESLQRRAAADQAERDYKRRNKESPDYIAAHAKWG